MQKKQDIFGFIRGRSLLSVIMGGLLILVGILFSDLPTMIASLGWSTTEGTITSHRFQGAKFKEYDGDFHEEIYVFIHYEYAVDGLVYSARSINAISRPFYLYPEIFADRYPIGKEVIVYYNSKDPSEAVLEPGFVDVFMAFDVFSYLIFGAGIYFVFLGSSRIKNRDRDQ